MPVERERPKQPARNSDKNESRQLESVLLKYIESHQKPENSSYPFWYQSNELKKSIAHKMLKALQAGRMASYSAEEKLIIQQDKTLKEVYHDCERLGEKLFIAKSYNPQK